VEKCLWLPLENPIFALPRKNPSDAHASGWKIAACPILLYQISIVAVKGFLLVLDKKIYFSKNTTIHLNLQVILQ